MKKPAPVSKSIDVQHVSIAYGANVAVDDVSLALLPGSVHALIGPNGSGKSSLINAIIGINPPKSGSISVAGMSVYATGVDAVAVRRNLGVIPDEDDLIELLTGNEYVALSSVLYGVTSKETRQRSDELADLFGMKHAMDQAIGSYSHGMRKKLACMAAMIAKPPIYVIDEPTNGLDPDMVLLIKEIITSLKKSGASVLIATHNLSFAQSIADSVTMLRAKVVASGSVADILEQARTKTLEDAYLKLSGHTKKYAQIESYIHR